MSDIGQHIVGPRNGVLQVVELAEVQEMNEEGDAEVVKTVGFVRVTVRSEVNSFPLPQNGVLQVAELAKAFEISEKGVVEGYIVSDSGGRRRTHWGTWASFVS